MTKGTVSIRYSTRRLTDGYDVAAIGADGEVLAVVTQLLSHGYALSQARSMAEQYGLPLVDHTGCQPAPLTSQQDWQAEVYRIND